MPDLTSTRDQLLDELDGTTYAGAPLRVVTERTKINPPCAYVALSGVPEVYLAGNVEVAWSVYLVANATDESRSVDELGDLLEVILPRLAPAGDIEFVGVSVPEHSTPLPALRVPVTYTTH